jgi:hypothetical protein
MFHGDDAMKKPSRFAVAGAEAEFVPKNACSLPLASLAADNANNQRYGS